MKVIVGVDIGGTEIKVGKFNDGQLIEKKSIKTDTTDYGSRIINDIFQVVDELLGQDTLEGIGIGVPGPVVKGIVLGAQNLGWDEIDLTSKVKHYPHAHVAIVNDANAATFGEVAYGSAKGYHHVVMITLGTGVGGESSFMTNYWKASLVQRVRLVTSECKKPIPAVVVVVYSVV